ncbi:MAG: hypothetical protein NC122_00895 [Faecalibacterium sp.]|nr:hypothetical protein [Ruminococcus sp.]MCM1391281.1 hypothetical protein [Ruminococcus sp.]MCM1484745.1 hypothetical protein [Faecalibacterium sp.]
MKKGDLIIWICTAVVFICTLKDKTEFSKLCCVISVIILIIDIIRMIICKRKSRTTEE